MESSRILARLWPAVLKAGGPRQNAAQAVKAQVYKLFEPAYLDTLSLPIGEQRPESQSVALVEGTVYQREFARSAEEAYDQRPRTRVYENLQLQYGAWYSLVALQLSVMAGCRVGCSVFESRVGDRTSVPHYDAWFGLILQMRGAKQWSVWNEDEAERKVFTTTAGDVLLLPMGMFHEVHTPEYSVHMVFAFHVEDG